MQRDWSVSKVKGFGMRATLPTCIVDVLRCITDRDAGYPD